MAVPTPISYGGGPAIIPLIPGLWGKPGRGDLRDPKGYINNEFYLMYIKNDCAKKCLRNFDAWLNLHYPIYGGVDISDPPKKPWGDDINETTLHEWLNQKMIYERAKAAHDAEEQKQQDIYDSCLDRCNFAYALGVPAL